MYDPTNFRTVEVLGALTDEYTTLAVDNRPVITLRVNGTCAATDEPTTVTVVLDLDEIAYLVTTAMRVALVQDPDFLDRVERENAEVAARQGVELE